MNTDEINKKLEGLIERNQSTFDEFVSNVAKVDLGIYSKTFKEKTEYEESIKDRPFSAMPKEVLEGLGFKPFYKYGELVIECIDKMATNEKKKEIVFNQEDVLNHGKWLERVKKMEDGDVWVSLNENLMWCIASTHEARVKIMRDKVKEGSENK